MSEDPYRILRAEFQERMKGSACEQIIQFQVNVGVGDEPNHAVIVFVIDNEKLGVDAEAAAQEAAIEQQVDDLKREMRAVELDQQEEAAKAEALAQLAQLEADQAAEDEATRQSLKATLDTLDDPE